MIDFEEMDSLCSETGDAACIVIETLLRVLNDAPIGKASAAIIASFSVNTFVAGGFMFILSEIFREAGGQKISREDMDGVFTREDAHDAGVFTSLIVYENALQKTEIDFGSLVKRAAVTFEKLHGRKFDIPGYKELMDIVNSGSKLH